MRETHPIPTGRFPIATIYNAFWVRVNQVVGFFPVFDTNHTVATQPPTICFTRIAQLTDVAAQCIDSGALVGLSFVGRTVGHLALAGAVLASAGSPLDPLLPGCSEVPPKELSFVVEVAESSRFCGLVTLCDITQFGWTLLRVVCVPRSENAGMVLATEATGLGGFLTVANGANSWYSCNIDSLLVGHGPSSSRYVGLFFTHIVSLI